MRKVLFGLAAVTVIFSVSCKKESDFVRATVINTGDVTEEGCGFLLRLNDGREEKPAYLPSAYRHNNLEVSVKFRSTGVLDTCQYEAPRKFFELVEIEDIKIVRE